MIQAKMICDSLDPRGNRLRTLEVIAPRYILAEFNTHRMLSRNSASSRAIPFKKNVREVLERGFIPYAWQKDHSGMQGTEYHTEPMYIHAAEEGWKRARDKAVYEASLLNTNCDTTKQLANRLLEPYMYHKMLVSGTEWDNFFNLRCPQYKIHQGTYKSRKDALKYGLSNGELKNNKLLDWLLVNESQADIHMSLTAEAIWDATNESTPVQLKEGEWHIPYGDQMDDNAILDSTVYGYESGNQETQGGWTMEGGEEAYYYTLNELKRKISVARCARLSYQTLGDNPVIDYAKDLELYDVLAKSGHFSPFEHVAKVMTHIEYYFEYIKGKRIYNEDLALYEDTTESLGRCLNFKGFIQERYLLEEQFNQ